jgi:hypothetical protein
MYQVKMYMALPWVVRGEGDVIAMCTKVDEAQLICAALNAMVVQNTEESSTGIGTLNKPSAPCKCVECGKLVPEPLCDACILRSVIG